MRHALLSRRQIPVEQLGELRLAKVVFPRVLNLAQQEREALAAPGRVPARIGSQTGSPPCAMHQAGT